MFLSIGLVLLAVVLTAAASQVCFSRHFPRCTPPLFSRDIARKQRWVDNRLHELFMEMWVYFELEKLVDNPVPQTRVAKRKAWAAHRCARFWGFATHRSSRSYLRDPWEPGECLDVKRRARELALARKEA